MYSVIYMWGRDVMFCYDWVIETQALLEYS